MNDPQGTSPVDDWPATPGAVPPLDLGAHFPPQTRADWLTAATAANRGRPPRLTATSVEGLPIDALPELPASPAPAVPGLAAAITARSEQRWDARALVDSGAPDALSAAIAADAAAGATSIWLVPACAGLRGALLSPTDAAGVATALSSLPAGCGLAIAAGAEPDTWLTAALAARPDLGQPGARLEIHGDPLAALALTGCVPGGITRAWDALAAATQHAARLPGDVRTIGISSLPIHDAGGHLVQSLAWTLAVGAETLRALEARGLPPEAVAARAVLQVGVGRDTFLELAGLRALRILWAHLLSACGVDATQLGARVHAVTTRITASRRDPWTNLLRSSAEAFAAAVGGADAITLMPFDHRLGAPDTQGRRLAITFQHVLAAEGHLARAADPAAGSAAIEHLTAALVRHAWTAFQATEMDGGALAALCSGRMAGELAQSAAARLAETRTRRTAVLGVSDFPDPQPAPPARTPPTRGAKTPPSDSSDTCAAPMVPFRLASAWESLRDAVDAHAEINGGRPAVWLATLGPLAAHQARAGFAEQLFAAGGFAAKRSEGHEDAAAVAEAYAASGAAIACLCGTDEAYGRLAAAAATALRDAGAEWVVLAGRPGDAETTLRAAGVTDFIYLGADVLGTLETLAARLGVALEEAR